MRELTQTVTASAENGWAGNCWQTCVAIVLDVDPAVLPDQGVCDLRRKTETGFAHVDSPYYYNRLQAYLRKHHGLAYVEFHAVDEAYALVEVKTDALHFMTGRTVRSDAYGGMRHVVVGQRGRMVWDPHPSHAGLLEEIRWAFLVPLPRVWRDSEPAPCFCPECLKVAA